MRLLALLALLPSLAWGAIAYDTTACPGSVPKTATISNATYLTLQFGTTFSTAGATTLVVVLSAADATGTSATSPATLAWVGGTPANASAWTKRGESTWVTTGANTSGVAIWTATTSAAVSGVNVVATRAGASNTGSALLALYALTGANTVGATAFETHNPTASTAVASTLTGTLSGSWLFWGGLDGNTMGTALAAYSGPPATTIDAHQEDGAVAALAVGHIVTSQAYASLGIGSSKTDIWSSSAALEITAAAGNPTTATLTTVSATGVVGAMSVLNTTANLTTVSANFVASSLNSSKFPLSWSGNNRYLVTPSGTPWRIQAEAAWLMTSVATRAQVASYLANRKAKGFNSVYLMSMVHSGGYSTYGAPNAPRNSESQYPFTTGGATPGAADFANPNPAYWDFVDYVVTTAAANDMAVMLAYNYLGYAGGNQGWAAEIGAMSSAQATAWGTWIGNRYKNNPNVIWFAAGDYRPPAGGTLESRVVDTINAIKATGATQVWMAELSDPDDIPSRDSPALTTAAGTMTNSFYGYGPTASYETYATADTAYRASPVRPAWMQEGTYEGEDNKGRGLGDKVWSARRGRFWSVLGGATAGDGFGSKDVWTMTNWPTSFESAGSVQSGYAFSLFASIPWWDMRPSGTGTGFAGATLISSGNGSCSGGDLTCITSAVSGDGKNLLAYVPGTDGGSAARTFSVAMSAMTGTSRARWWNPVTGAYTAIGSYPNTGTQSFTTPGSNTAGNDWMLVLDPMVEVVVNLSTVFATGLVGSPNILAASTATLTSVSALLLAKNFSTSSVGGDLQSQINDLRNRVYNLELQINSSGGGTLRLIQGGTLR